MMPMWVFAVLQLLVLMYLCVKLLKEAKVVDLCVRKNLEYLDGLKGIGCVAVFLTHFVYAFYYGMYHYDPAGCHLPGKIDIVIGKFPSECIF